MKECFEEKKELNSFYLTSNVRVNILIMILQVVVGVEFEEEEG